MLEKYDTIIRIIIIIMNNDNNNNKNNSKEAFMYYATMFSQVVDPPSLKCLQKKLHGYSSRSAFYIGFRSSFLKAKWNSHFKLSLGDTSLIVSLFSTCIVLATCF